MADNDKQITIWGRPNSVNVQKVLWCLHELDLAYQRIDAGMAFGRNTEPDYLAINPNARVPTLVEGDFVLWESNSVMRYLAMALSAGIAGLSERAENARRYRSLAGLDAVDGAAGRSSGVLGDGANPPAQRDMVAIQKDVDAEAEVWKIADERLATHRYFEGDAFTLADIAVGAFARRWFGVDGVSKPRLAHLERWYAEIAERPGFQEIHRAADVVTAEATGRQRPPLTPTLMSPPTFTQVSLPLTLTKFGPYAAQALASLRLVGNGLSGVSVLAGFRGASGSAAAIETDSAVIRKTSRMFRIAPFIAVGVGWLANELDAGRLAAAPHHFAAPSGAGIARKCQLQPARQRVGIINRDLGAGGRHVLHHARACGEAAIEGDPPWLLQRLAHFALLGGSGHFEHS